MSDNRIIFFAHQDGCIKINCSSHLPNRLKLIKEETGKPVELLGIQAGGDDVLAVIQSKFKHIWVRDDWYRYSVELMEYIEQNATYDRTKPLNWQEIREKFGCNTLSDRGKECLKLLEMTENLPSVNEEEKLLSIEEAASMLGVAQQTLRRWQEKGKIEPQFTEKGHRRYTKSQIMEIKRQQLKDQEFLLFNITPNDIIEMVYNLLASFDPLEKINVSVKQDSLLGKVRFTIDTADGLNSVTKSFDQIY